MDIVQVVNLQFAITVSVGRAKIDLRRTDHRINNQRTDSVLGWWMVWWMVWLWLGVKAANRVAMGYLVMKLLHIH